MGTKPGMTGRGRAAHGAMQRARAIELRATGMTFAQIAAAMGISRQAAAKHVAKSLEELDASTMESARRLRRLESINVRARRRPIYPAHGCRAR